MAMIGDLRGAGAALQPSLVAMRRDFHAHPELAFEEHRTARVIAERLRGLGMRVESIGGTGVLAVLEGASPGKTVLLRSDIDAVDQTEAPGREYGSTIEGRNHSCGHDIDMTMLLGAAELLAGSQAGLAGTVAFVFQPADEPMTGARHLFADGLWDRVTADAVLGLHIAPDVDAGKVVAQGGPVWASMDTHSIRLTRPSAPPDVTFAAAQLVTALYGAIEAQTTALQGGSFAVTAIEAKQPRGAPAEAMVSTRLAVFDNRLRSALLQRIETVSRSMAAAFDMEIAIAHETEIPAIENDAAVAAVVAEAVREQLGGDAVVQHRHPVADDFSLFLEKVPGAMVLFGTRNAAKGITANWHTPEYDCDEDVLEQGARVMAAAAVRLLG